MHMEEITIIIPYNMVHWGGGGGGGPSFDCHIAAQLVYTIELLEKQKH